MPRKRCFQEGTLTQRGKRQKKWVARWREDAIGTDNQLVSIRRSAVLFGAWQE